MSFGQYRHKVIIQRNTPTTNDYNEDIASWSTLKTVSGKVTYLTGREGINADGLDFIQRMQFESWYKNLSNVTNRDRISYDGAIWNIQSVQPIQEKNKLFIIAEKADNNE